MLELQTKIKRQIEILGLAVNNEHNLKDADFAVMFGRDIPTIKRDMQELRSCGIDLHSEKKRGICIGAPIEPQLLRELIAQYLGICSAASAADKATVLLVQQQKAQALYNVVTLQRCIDQSRMAVISYRKEGDDVEERREISPLLLFSSEGSWRVLAVHEGRIKQYHLNKIVCAAPSPQTFKRLPQEEIDAMFRHSFRSWIGNDQIRIRLRLLKPWADRVKPRQMMETQVITEEPGGSVVLESIVNSLDEVASWVVSRGEGVIVLEPEELRAKVIALARGALENYE